MQRRQKEESDLEQSDSSSLKAVAGMVQVDMEGRAHQLEGHRNKRVGPCPKNSITYLCPSAEWTAAKGDRAGGERETQSRESLTGRHKAIIHRVFWM